MAVVTPDLLKRKKAPGPKILANLESQVLLFFQFSDGVPPSPIAPAQRGLTATFCVRRPAEVKHLSLRSSMCHLVSTSVCQCASRSCCYVGAGLQTHPY